MLKNIWNKIKELINRLDKWFGQAFEDPEMEIYVLNQRYAHLYNAYLEVDKRTSAAKRIKEEMNEIKMQIDELKERIHG